MRYGIFSDVHSNLEALEVVLAYYKKEAIDQFIFLGDLIGYASRPNQCIAKLKEINPICILGNHECGVLDKLDLEYFNPIAKASLLWTKENILSESLAYIRTWQLIHEDLDFICVHGHLFEPERFNYILDKEDAKSNFILQNKLLCFVGHTHKMAAYWIDQDNQVGYIGIDEDKQITLEGNNKYIINVGSVGQPRDYNPKAGLCIYDTKQNIVIFKRLEYNINKAASDIITLGLPNELGARLFVGW